MSRVFNYIKKNILINHTQFCVVILFIVNTLICINIEEKDLNSSYK